MGLRDIIRAIREYPAALAELQRTQQALARSEQTCVALRDEAGERANHERFLTRQLAAVQTTLKEFCPKLSSLEDMKRFYDTLSPSVDPQGFTLYHIAEKLTGIDVSSFFPYEDNRGLFEEADGSQLLRWLAAAHFGAVDWAIVPGTTYERATLREMDTSTPEYREFERQIYKKTLERMGFQDVLAPEKEQITELKLYSPLSGELAGPENNRRETLDGSGLAVFRDVILQGIEDGQFSEEAERGLMIYYDGPSAVDEKVISLFPAVEELDGVLCGVAVCRVRGELTPGELEELKEYCHSQYNDAWGEEFRERARHTEYGDLYVSFWLDSSAALLTKEELDRASSLISRQIRKEREKSR